MTGWIRRTHRWLSIAFTAMVIVNFIALGLKKQTAWVGFLALVPLFLLLFSGLYLFALPYVAKRRGERIFDLAMTREAQGSPMQPSDA